MKTLPLLAASLFALSAYATETPVSFDQFVDAAVKNSTQMVTAGTIKLATDPVNFSLNVGRDATISTDAKPAALFAAIRARVPSTTIAGTNGQSFVLDYGRLTVKSSDTTLPAIYDVQKDIADYYAESSEDLRDMASYVSNDYKPRSVVGSIVSYYYTSDTYGAGAAHPDSGDGINAVDISKVERNGDSLSFALANLADIVDENSLVAALKADKWINKTLKAADRRKLQATRNFQELSDALSEGFMNSESCYSSPAYDGKLSSFAIYDYNAAKNLVAVRVTVGYSAHACAAAAPTVQLGLLVKPRFDLEYALKDQTKNKTGLLMKNAGK